MVFDMSKPINIKEVVYKAIKFMVDGMNGMQVFGGEVRTIVLNNSIEGMFLKYKI